MITQDIARFEFDSQELRTVTGEDGEPWFVASDVAGILGYRDAGNLTRMIDEDDKGTHNLSTPGGKQTVTTISEAGLYAAILKSRVPNAQPFRRWVTHEVLPTIRKTGMYATPEAARRFLQDPQALMYTLQALQDEKNKTKALEQKVEQDAPKVLFADAVATSKTSILIGDLAKILKSNGINIGQNRLFAWMREKDYLCKNRGEMWNMPTQKSMELGLFEVKESTHQQPDGTVRITKTTKVTGKGQQYFINKFCQTGTLCR
ncbi:phage antirepressor [Mobiluncus curtisii]|uniref:phage antirepressor n=1 Tax=Mobiluncus curtisii TaxID=2051 RepID=UPI00242C28AC|nr:phage antirepressor KilAC domain-containing protein [Mobiluncus curtisii]